MKEKNDIVILGGGLAGLACADELLRKKPKNITVTVLEKNPYPGGLAATLKYNGFKFDLAPHRWFTKNEELNKWLNELMGKNMVLVDKHTPMYQHGQFYDYPVKIFDVLFKVGIFKSVFMLLTYVYARISNRLKRKKIHTLKDAYINRFGYALYKWFNEEYNEKLWGKDAGEKMSADFVDQRVKNLSMTTAIKSALGIDVRVISLTPSFKFPKYGTGMISDALVKRIVKNGGKIIYNSPVIKIKKISNKYKIYTKNSQYSADNLVSSIPLDIFFDILDFSKPFSVTASRNKLKFIDQKIVVLFFNKEKLTEYTWVYVHPKNIGFFRFLETNNWSLLMSPPGKTSVVFEYPYQKGDFMESISDNELIRKTTEDFIAYFSPKTKYEDVIDGKVYHVNKAYPKYDLLYKDALNVLKIYLKKQLNNMQLIGRNGMFRYNNMDHSIYTGILGARNIIKGKQVYNLEMVNNEAEYLEEKR